MSRGRRALRVAAGLAGALLLAWAGFVGLTYAAMSGGPRTIGRFMAAVPGPAYAVLPFETLWNRARAGTLQPGELAPDFELPTPDGTTRMRLSSFRGRRPVVLVFGSYT